MRDSIFSVYLEGKSISPVLSVPDAKFDNVFQTDYNGKVRFRALKGNVKYHGQEQFVWEKYGKKIR